MMHQSNETPRVLVAEDDVDIRELITHEMEREGFVAVAAGSIAEVREALRHDAFGLLLLDLGLPDGDGLRLCCELREGGHDGQIMMVTARDAPADRVLGLEMGADDYLAKPFEPRELVMRVRNLLRHQEGMGGRRQPVTAATFGRWRLDLRHRRLYAADGRLVMLSSAEFGLLRRFIEAPGRVLSREELSPQRSMTVGYDRSIDVRISRLRQKLAISRGDGGVILTVRNEGYVLPGPVAFE